MSCNVKRFAEMSNLLPGGGNQIREKAGKDYFLLHSTPQHRFRPYIAFAFSSTDIVEELLDSSRLINSN